MVIIVVIIASSDNTEQAILRHGSNHEACSVLLFNRPALLGIVARKDISVFVASQKIVAVRPRRQDHCSVFLTLHPPDLPAARLVRHEQTAE